MADEDQTLMERFGGFSRQPAVGQLALLMGLARVSRWQSDWCNGRWRPA